MLRKVLSFIICGFVMISTTIPVMALETEEMETSAVINKDALTILSLDINKVSEPFEPGEASADIGTISYNTALVLDNNEVMMYPTYDNNIDALSNIKEACNIVLTEMANVYELDAFSSETWQDYYDNIHMYEEYVSEVYIDETMQEAYDLRGPQIILLNEFFDIYENYGINEEIINEVSMINQGTVNLTASELQSTEFVLQKVNQIKELSLIMPSNTGWEDALITFEQDIVLAVPELGAIAETAAYSKNSNFTVSKGVTYAVEHATDRNSSEYGTKSKDCTNFTSQIKHEGGVAYYNTGQTSGWSHWLQYNSDVPTHAHSTKWVNADAFAKFFGVKSSYKTASYDYTRTAFIKFAAAIKKGSFISYDKTADGDWNHNAFVTYLWHSGESARRNISYHGSTYKDFKVAQHTKDYHRWVSKNGEEGNAWEELPYNYSKIVFAIIN